MDNAYILTPDGELYHYGVVGMKWGVRRNTKRLSSDSSAQREKAVKSLKKHRDKASNEIKKLHKTTAKLEKRSENNVVSAEMAAAKLNRQAADYRRRASRRFTSDNKAQKYITKASIAETKAKDLMARVNETKAKINKNKMLISMFEKGIGDIDAALTANGRKYVAGNN